MALRRRVLRALRIVMIWFVVAFVLAFILVAVLIQRIAGWARGLLHSN
jgi:uncharacterized membrane protein